MADEGGDSAVSGYKLRSMWNCHTSNEDSKEFERGVVAYMNAEVKFEAEQRAQRRAKLQRLAG